MLSLIYYLRCFILKHTSAKKYYRYMPVTEHIGQELSKGRNTRVGCMLLSTDRSTRSIGYNGAPRHCKADEDGDWRRDKPEKYFWLSHAEMNAITNAARCGTPIENCIAIVTHLPCMECAKALAQSGIRMVICKRPTDRYMETWGADIVRTKILFKEIGIPLIII